MDKRWKNLIAVVFVLALICIAAYFLSVYKQQPKKNTFGELRAIWHAYGIKAEYLNNAYGELTNLSDAELKSLNYELGAFQKRCSVAWLSELASIYRLATNIESSTRRVSALRNKVAELKAPCDNKELFTELLKEQEELVSLVKLHGSKIRAFSKKYPSKARKAGFNENVGYAMLEKKLALQKALVNAMKEACK